MPDMIKRILELEGQLRYHDYLYYELDSPQISDDKYDELNSEYLRLRDKRPEYKTGYVQGFVAPDPSMKLVPIVEPMLSVSKCKDKDMYLKWVTNKADSNAIHEDKIDGMALRIIYVDGNLSRIHTRGSNQHGADISHRRFLLRNVPDYIEADVNKGRTEYTGEAFCMYRDFENYLAKNKLDPKSTDPRSTVSGMMKRHEASERDKDLPIYFKVYGASQNVRADFETYAELRDHFTNIGFDVPMLVDGGMLQEFLELPTKPNLGYPIDGLVAKVNNLRKWDVEQGNQYWTYATCYKFPTIFIETEVTGIDWSIGLDGALHGTLLYNPVKYDGTTLSRAKLNYAQSYFDKGLAIGSTIQITKSNEIIPHIVGMVKAGDGEKLKYPDACPFCGQMVTFEQDAGMAYCNNEACEGQLTRQLIRLVDRKYGLDIKGLGDVAVTALLDNGMLSTAADLFALTEEDMVSCGIHAGVAEKAIAQIKNLNSLDLHRWLSALGIPNLGLVRAMEISKHVGTNRALEGEHFHDLDELMEKLTDANFLFSLFGLDGLVIGSYVQTHEDDIKKFLSHYDFTIERTPSLNGFPVSITGSWVAMQRQMLVDKLAEVGFIVTDKVNRSSKVLLVGDKPSATKLEKAKALNIPVVDIRSLHELKSIIAVLSK